MTDQPSIKLFDLNRLAKFEDPRNKDAIYIVPGEVVALIKLESDETWIEYGQGNKTLVRGGVQLVEDEINRALGATYAAHLAAAKSSGEQLNAILRKVRESPDDEEIFNMNDFVPKGVN